MNKLGSWIPLALNYERRCKKYVLDDLFVLGRDQNESLFAVILRICLLPPSHNHPQLYHSHKPSHLLLNSTIEDIYTLTRCRMGR